jgi:DNA-binding GntR family transcriptional regulator
LRAGQAKGYPPDLDFHRSVISLSGNSRLQDAVDHQQKVILLSRARSGALPDRAREAYEEHRAVAKAIAEADADSAAQAMQNHLENAYISARGQLCRASEVCSL